MMMRIFILLVFVLFSCFIVPAQTMSDVDKIMFKLKNMEFMIDPPDSRNVQEIYEGTSSQDKSTLLTRVVDESLTKKLWDDISSDSNRKDLLQAGLSNSKTKELLDVWDKVKEKRDFILKKMDEISESDPTSKSGFDTFMRDYIKNNNVMIDSNFEFEYKDLNRYTLGYLEKGVDPEFVKVTYTDGLILKFPLSDLPLGLKKIGVRAGDVTYSNKNSGKFVVNVSDMYPADMGRDDEWGVKGFVDLAGNVYSVVINFGEAKNGVIETLKGGFIISVGSRFMIDNDGGTVYDLSILDEDTSSFMKVYDNGVYLFHGVIGTSFLDGRFNFSEVAIDSSGVVTDIVDRLSYDDGVLRDSLGNLESTLGDYSNKFISIGDDATFSGGKVMRGNFDKVLGRQFQINSEGGIDYEFMTADLLVHSGHLITDNSLILQLGFINAQRYVAGTSDVLLDATRVGSSLVDPSSRRGANEVRGFTDLFGDLMLIIDKYFDYSASRDFVGGFI